MNVGPAVVHDLQLLGITTVKQLAKQSPEDLFRKLELVTEAKQNPCVFDVFVAIIHEAQTGEKIPWWHFSPFRTFGKKRKPKR